jgi:L,D-transpeptidase catalytic domain
MMAKFLTAIVILVLLAGNIYFYTKSKEKAPVPKVMGVAAPVNTSTADATATSAFKYIAPAFEMNNEMMKVKNNRSLLKEYAVKNKCNQDYAFIIDMRIPSYKKRFFVYNLKKDSLISSGFVAHGTGSETFRGELVFSNTPDSRCTSLGKYKISNSYIGMYGFSYRLLGLDSTNNKALQRAIVLHGNSCVPDKENDEYPICFSYGCPMVSTVFLKQLKGYISKQGKLPILMSIIY